MPSFNNVTFKSLGLKHKSDNHLDSFEDDVEYLKAPGRTGDLIVNHGGKLNKDIEIKCNLDCRNKNTKNIVDNIEAVFKGVKGYARLTFEDGFIFDANCKGKIVYNELFPNYYEVSIVFTTKEV